MKMRTAAALLAATGFAYGQNASMISGPPWMHSKFTSSPPVYPSPNAIGLGWDAAFQQASDFVDQLTLQEKTMLVTGETGPCTGNIPAIPRLGFEGLCLMDGPLAIRQADFASAFPAGITVAAAWDRDLARQRGQELGAEFKAKGAHVILGPVAGPLGRSGERSTGLCEAYGHPSNITIASSADELQDYIGNEQETQRNPSENEDGKTIEAVSSNIDDRTMHEVYLWPFQNAVKAGVASMMCSYNRINGSYGCQNSKTQNGLLKDELGFQGYIMSDWGATHSGYPAILAGEDMDMPGTIGFTPGGPSFFGGNITKSVNNGSLPLERANDMCRRIMTPYFQFQQTSYPMIDASEPALAGNSVSDYNYTFNLGNQSDIDVRDDHSHLIRELGAAGTVLLKNTNNTLPLKTPKNVGVFGNDAADITIGLYFGSDPDLQNIGYDIGVLPIGGGSGTARMTYVVNPLDAIKQKVASYDEKALVQYVLNNTLVIDSGGFDILFPRPPEVCLVFLKTWATEGYDRPSLLVDWNGTALVESVASQCPNTVVITHSGGLNVLPFADHPNVTAILAAHYPGEQVGNSIVDILWGDMNPSGHLPYTIAKHEDDYSFADITNSTALLNTQDPNAWQSDFKERLLVDYRKLKYSLPLTIRAGYFDYVNQSVQYEFGYGLSYTTFSMGSVSVQPYASALDLSATPPAQQIVPGGNPALWEKLYCVTATVSNTGSVAGAAVPQVYLGLPQPANQDTTPRQVLRGFEKMMLQPGESREVRFDLTRRDVSYWDVVTQQWTIGQGSISVMAGFSSRDVQGTASFSPLG
ncbi:uncharacterized protein LTR77_001078 [Saxophila tyrrhenica]|uniref:Probable beta-glucosidase G n=1 Tax=Saxophila tyrrhenica TaxID=1690608 RepID=A0AAV9PKG1_9PEZI|nr:hypothetical protein LTR77_001078 [Saxophila tyrrhenica]